MGETPQEEPDGDPGKVAGTKKKGNRYEYTEEFEQFWSVYPRKKEKPGAFKTWKTRLKEGCTAEDMIAAAKHYAQECKRLGTEEKYIKHAKTFLGPDKPFEDYVNPPPESKGGNLYGFGKQDNKPGGKNNQGQAEEFQLDRSKFEFQG
jgi:hypothetical protein